MLPGALFVTASYFFQVRGHYYLNASVRDAESDVKVVGVREEAQQEAEQPIQPPKRQTQSTIQSFFAVPWRISRVGSGYANLVRN